MVFGCVEEGADGDARAVGGEAAGILLVGFFRLVVRIEVADSVVDAAAAFPECFCNGEAEVAPVGVACGDVGGGGFDSLRDGLDVILQ